MNSRVSNLQRMFEPVVVSLGYEFVGCEFITFGKHRKFCIYIDKEDGVTIEDCTKVSRQISAILDVEEPISGEFRLEVSSPGFDRPLFKLAQFGPFIGERIKLRLIEPLGDRRNFVGELIKVEGNQVAIHMDGEEFIFDYENINKANLAPL
jgi:ribosome maturation factor RimP